MSHHRPVDYTPAETRRALEIAAADGRDYLDWPDLEAARAALTHQPPPAQNKPTGPTPMCQTVPTPANARQPVPPHAPAQNEPTPAAPTCQTVANTANQCQTVPAPAPARNEPTARPAPPEGCQTLPNGAKRCQPVRISETNPPSAPPAPRPPRPLTPDQLRAARLLVAGHRSSEIAFTLRLNRHTIAKWKRLPLFQRELRRLVAAAAPRASHDG